MENDNLKKLCYYIYDIIAKEFKILYIYDDKLDEKRNNREIKMEEEFEDFSCRYAVTWNYLERMENKKKFEEKRKGPFFKMKMSNVKESLPTVIKSKLTGKNLIKLSQFPNSSVSIDIFDDNKNFIDLKDVHDANFIQGKHGIKLKFNLPKERSVKRIFLPNEFQNLPLESVIDDFVNEMYDKYLDSIHDDEIIPSEKQQEKDIDSIYNSLSLIAFETTKFSLDYIDYENYKAEKYKNEKRFKYLKFSQNSIKSNAIKESIKDKPKKDSKIIFYIICLSIIVLFYFSFSSSTYNVKEEDFFLNYSVLGLEQGTDLKAVNKKFRRLSLEWHPDKCKDCDPAVFEKMVEAHRQINDYEKGILTFTKKKFN
eukprot:TRINITY_DN3433_c1_g3_i2.p1 TRINITY_DN3433_c1_g3~~TRINITY_DN3433_c1_g3_i2.p1  ORF type:complete len:368 (+),score=74.19 TRINITY_DN3433_c1_g3_i2:930-2033(+)